MKLKTNKLLLISIILIIGAFILAMFSEDLGLSDEINPYLVFPFLIAFGLNVAGLFFGYSEKRKSGKKSLIGLIGNSFLIIMFISICLYAITKM